MRRTLWPDLDPQEEEGDADTWLVRPDAAVIVAERAIGSGLAGFAEVGSRAYADGCATQPVAYLEAWYVDADLRRQGIGAALVEAVEAWARERGFHDLASDALLENVASQGAHLSIGFAEVERTVKYCKRLSTGT